MAYRPTSLNRAINSGQAGLLVRAANEGHVCLPLRLELSLSFINGFTDYTFY